MRYTASGTKKFLEEETNSSKVENNSAKEEEFLQRIFINKSSEAENNSSSFKLTAYHTLISRDWQQLDNNSLVLFEEFGGNLYSVSFEIVIVGKICAKAYNDPCFLSLFPFSVCFSYM